jgi:hypothetical protein
MEMAGFEGDGKHERRKFRRTQELKIVSTLTLDIARARYIWVLGIKVEETDTGDFGAYVSDGCVPGYGAYLCEYGDE